MWLRHGPLWIESLEGHAQQPGRVRSQSTPKPGHVRAVRGQGQGRQRWQHHQARLGRVVLPLASPLGAQLPEYPSLPLHGHLTRLLLARSMKQVLLQNDHGVHQGHPIRVKFDGVLASVLATLLELGLASPHPQLSGHDLLQPGDGSPSPLPR